MKPPPPNGASPHPKPEPMTRDRMAWEARELMGRWERLLRTLPALPLLVVASEYPVEARNVIMLIDHGHTAEHLASVLEQLAARLRSGEIAIP